MCYNLSMKKVRGLKNIADVMIFLCSCCCQRLVKQYIKKGKCKYCFIHCWAYLVEDNKGYCLKYNKTVINERNADGYNCRFCGKKIKEYHSDLHYWAKICRFEF